MTAVRHGGKSAAAFRTISEVADDLDVPQHVLRFWETKFSQVRPLKRGGGRRYYRPEDVELLRHIRDLLYTDGYTIKGVQRLLRESGGRAGAGATAGTAAGTAAEAAAGGEEGLTAAQRKALTALRDELLALRELLKSVGS
jgi:DNA-binding transcriptional MerR regulator